MLRGGGDDEPHRAALRTIAFGPLQGPVTEQLAVRGRRVDAVSTAALREERCGIQLHTVADEQRRGTKGPAPGSAWTWPNHVRFQNADEATDCMFVVQPQFANIGRRFVSDRRGGAPHVRILDHQSSRPQGWMADAGGAQGRRAHCTFERKRSPAFFRSRRVCVNGP